MRTKTLLVTAALTAASALSSMAQVYSVNVVGYINITVQKGLSLIANQLNNGSPVNNTWAALIPTPPTGTIIYKLQPNGTYHFDVYDAGAGSWGGDYNGTGTMNPGEGVFIFAPSAFPVTFVGEVQLTSSTFIQTKLAIVSSVVPQAAALWAATQTDPLLKNPLNFGQPQDQQITYQFRQPWGQAASPQTFNANNVWDGGTLSWSGDSGPDGPTLAVGESFISFIPPASGAKTWTRTFSVGP